MYYGVSAALGKFPSNLKNFPISGIGVMVAHSPTRWEDDVRIIGPARFQLKGCFHILIFITTWKGEHSNMFPNLSLIKTNNNSENKIIIYLL